MLQWLSENIGTIIVCALLISFFVVMTIRHFKKRKEGRASGCACGRGCTCCPNCGNCDSHTH